MHLPKLVGLFAPVLLLISCGENNHAPRDEKIDGKVIPASSSPANPFLGAPWATPLLPDSPEKSERAGNHDDNICDDCIYASSSFIPPNNDAWYDLELEGYPITDALSINGNNGFSDGNILVTDTGITINESGDYWVSFTVILLNEDDEELPLIPLFLIRDGVFEPLNTPNYLGTTVSLPYGVIMSVNSDGILKDLHRGSTLSIVATTGDGEIHPVTVLSWAISVYRICN